MKKNILCFLAVAVLTSACDEMQEVQTAAEARVAPNIKAYRIPPCVYADAITITAQNANYQVAPPNFCADAGQTITVRFAGNKPAGTIILTAKSWIGDAKWLYAVNPGGPGAQTATIQVPLDAGAGELGDGERADYLYNVTFVGELVIDPMMSVD